MVHHESTRRDTLTALLAKAGKCVSDPSSGQSQKLARLAELRQRLATDRFQLAVLGQFKRGKSTLLNALLGASVLPTAVVPLTAIPTFIEGGTAPCIRTVFLSGAMEETKAERLEEIADRRASTCSFRLRYWNKASC
jgi:ribosome biogenesis GTPase A